MGSCAYPGRYVYADGTVVFYCYGCSYGETDGLVGREFNGLANAPTGCTYYYANTTDMVAGTPSACPFTNCSYCSLENLSGTVTCMACLENFVLNNAGTACATATADGNCKRLDSAGTGCEECWWPYYFQATLCLKSRIDVLNVLALLLIMGLSYINFI